jgi:hypothetical protein
MFHCSRLFRQVAPTIGLCLCCALANAQQNTAAATLTDISSLGAQSSAVARIVNQGIIAPLSPGNFGPQEIISRRQFAVAMKRMFDLQIPPHPPAIHDLADSDPDAAAIKATASFMQSQAFCPTCALNNNFEPDAPMSEILQAVTLTSILESRHHFALVSTSDAESILSASPSLPHVATPARIFLATAVRNSIVTLDDLQARQGVLNVVTRANAAILLDTIQQRFKIPTVQIP